MGYAAGALLCGVLADYAGISFSFISAGIITVIAGLGANCRMRCKTSHPELWVWIRSGFRRMYSNFSATDHHPATGIQIK